MTQPKQADSDVVLEINAADSYLRKLSYLLANGTETEISQSIVETKKNAERAIESIVIQLSRGDVLDTSCLGAVLLNTYESLDGFWGYDGHGFTIHEVSVITNLILRRISSSTQILTAFAGSLYSTTEDCTATGFLHYLRYLELFASLITATQEDPLRIQILKRALTVGTGDYPPPWRDVMRKRAGKFSFDENSGMQVQMLIESIPSRAGFIE